MDWTDQAIVLSTRPYGEAGLIASVLAEAHGRHAGHVPGGQSSAKRALWQPGNLLDLRWGGRTSDQLGTFTGELADAAASRALDDPWALGILLAATLVADGALPEREPHPKVFQALAALLRAIGLGRTLLPGLVAFEAGVLAELGYGLDLERCAVTGATEGLALVSPRTGRAVSEAGAGEWREKLLRLPPFMLGAGTPGPRDLADGLKLTGHFLATRPFAAIHRNLPAARESLYDRLVAWAAVSPAESPPERAPSWPT
jgi:DNA repair protein RecO (recombination protein O)